MRRCPENDGVERHELRRGDALLTPDQFHRTDVVDVRVHGDAVAFLPKSVMLHLGSAEVSGRVCVRSAPTPHDSLSRTRAADR